MRNTQLAVRLFFGNVIHIGCVTWSSLFNSTYRNNVRVIALISRHNKCPKWFGKRPHRRFTTANGFVWSWPHRQHDSFVSHESAPNGILTGSAVFAQYVNVSNTQTYRPRYVNICRNRTHYAMHAMRPKNKTDSNFSKLRIPSTNTLQPPVFKK